MSENSLFAGFVAFPVVLLFGLVFFFRAIKRRTKPTKWPQLLAGNTLVFLFLGSVVLLCGEVYYRFIYDTTESFGLSKTTENWFERHFHSNHAGFRDSVEYWYDLEPGQLRVTFFGDSFTAGHGVPNVEDRFANRIRAAGLAGEVHVLAECGMDTGHELAMSEALIAGNYEFDVVVLVYCLNDISDIIPEWQGILRRIYHAPSPGFLVEESYFLNAYYCRLKAARDPTVSDYYDFVVDGYEGAIWEQQQERLTRMCDGVQGQGGRFLVVTFPFLHALGPEYKYRLIHERLNQHWADLGVPHLDLLDVFESSDPNELTVNARDVHPNEKAHAMAAEAIADFLTPHLQAPSGRMRRRDALEQDPVPPQTRDR